MKNTMYGQKSDWTFLKEIYQGEIISKKGWFLDRLRVILPEGYAVVYVSSKSIREVKSNF